MASACNIAVIKRFPALRFDRVTGVDPCYHRTTATAAAITALLSGRPTIIVC
jgi:hypothetical protein